MKWDYFTYRKQPYWFVTALNNIINEEINHKNKEIRREQRKNGR